MGTDKLSQKLEETAGVSCDGPAFLPGGSSNMWNTNKADYLVGLGCVA